MNNQNNLTKDKISKIITSELGYSEKFSKDLVTGVIDIINEMLIKNKSVTITNFGTFKIVKKSERMANDLNTGEKTIVLPRKVISFLPSKNFKAELNPFEY